MSRVKIVIDDVQWGLNLSPEHTIDLVQALNAVAVTARKSPTSNEASNARNSARDAFEHIISEISFASRKSA